MMSMSSMSDLVGPILFVACLLCAIGAMTILMLSEVVYRVLRRFTRKEGE